MSQDKLFFSNDFAYNHWTALPQLELRGVDTPYIESLFSYVMRLSYLSNITTNQLYKSLRRHGIPKDEYKYFSSHHLSSWVGPSTLYNLILTPLSLFTGQTNLHKGTFHVASQILNSRNLFPRSNSSRSKSLGIRQWCPNCYLEWNFDTSFEPLIWAFALLTACPIHNVLLETKCSSCGSFQPTVNDYEVRRRCHKCKAELGHLGVPAKLSHIEDWIDKRLISFCSYIKNLDTPIPFSQYHDCLHGLAKRKFYGEELPPALREFISDLKFKSKYYDLALPAIDHYLNICAFLGTTIEDILENPSISEIEPLFDRTHNFSKLLFLKISVNAKLRRIGLCMQELLKHNEIILPPVAVLIKRFSVSSQDLRICHPDILQRYRDRLQYEYEYLIRRAQRLALDYALNILDTEYDVFDPADFTSFTNRISENTGVILPYAKSCAETAIVLHTIQYSLIIVDNGSIEQDSKLDAWINGYFQ